jgi:DNA-binding NarL/FixJ family response regulator
MDGAAAFRVVLVEDHQDYREQLQALLLDMQDIEVVHATARSGEAVQWLQANPRAWDLLVLDMFLADGHGFQVLRASQGRTRRQHAVFLTSYTRDPARSHALAAGADAVFDKVEVQAFLDYVRQRREEALGHVACP